MVTSEEVVDVVERNDVIEDNVEAAVTDVAKEDVVSLESSPEVNSASGDEADSAKLSDVKEIIAFLAEKFPKCFTVEGEAKPLKIGIFKELAEQVADDNVVSRTQLRQALRRYTSSWRYLKCVAKGGHRINLEGEPGEALEENHITHAAQALQESKARFEKSRKTLKDKKFYKKTQKETGETPTKQAKFNSSKHDSAASGVNKKSSSGKAASNGAANNGKDTTKRSNKRDAKKVVSQPIELLPLSEAQKCEGTAVLVKFGQSPVPGVIQEVSKGDAHVQLNSGMVIKTKLENLFVS